MIQRNKKELEISEEIGITLPHIIKIIKEVFPEGYDYAKRVGGLAYNLHESVDSFYFGVLTQDYGWYPFLTVKELHYEEACVCEDSIVLKSKFDMELFNEWMDCLSISSNIRDMIKGEVRVYYDNYHQKNISNLDMVYLDVMEHLIQSFKCLKTHYEYARSITEKFDLYNIGYSYPVKLSKVLTISYLMKRVNKFNKNKGASLGRYLLVTKTGSEDQVMVICQKYNKK